jgi:hypothetical protein
LQEELVMNRALTNAEMQLVALRAERVAGRRGTLRQRGEWVEWRDVRDRLYLAVVREPGRTRIRVIADQSRELLAGSTFIGIIGVLNLQMATGMDPVRGGVVGVLIAGATYGLIRLYWKWRQNVTREHLQELLEILEDTV